MKTLRIGFLLQDSKCPQWQLDILQRIEKVSSLEICLLAFNGETLSSKKPSSNKKLHKESTEERQGPSNSKDSQASRGFIFRAFKRLERPIRIVHYLFNPFGYGIPSLYQRWDEKCNADVNRLWVPQAIGPHPSASKVTFQPIRKGFTHRFNHNDIQTIKENNLDVIIRFGFSIIRGDIHNASRLGVWSFHHGDNRFYRGGPSGIWELIKGKAEIAVTLQQLSDVLDCGHTIGRSIHRADLYSALRNKHIIYSSCGDLLLQKLEQTQSMGFDSIRHTAIFNEPIPTRKILKSPRNFEFLPLFITLAKNYVGLRWPRNKKIQWFLAIKPLDKRLDQFNQSTLILPPIDRFYADPFILSEGNKKFIIFEEFIYSDNKAHISVGELKNGALHDVKPIIQEDFHLSYPFIFRDNGGWFLIPESRKNKCVHLYKCTEFPYQWQRQSILIEDIELLDPTIYKQDGTYFLFANQYLAKRNTSNECLVVYFSDSLEGNWEAHPLNPLTTNITNSRPAGKLFRHQDKLVLPTQNCARRYGYAINFNEVEISETHFSMKKISSLSPGWYKGNLGSHTWNSDDDTVVIDGHRYIDT